MILVVALASCKKTPEVNLKYVDVERDLVTVGTTTATIQCDYAYIATLKKAYLFYGEGQDEAIMTSAEMRVVQNTLYVELTGLKENTTYSYYYEFHNGFNSMRTALKSFKTEAGNGGGEEPPTPEITLPTVITASVTDITSNSAKGGGEVTSDGGAEVTERGICWSTNANPTLNDSHVAVGTGIGVFNATVSGLNESTTYHIRAYAINEKGTAYGLDVEFTTLSSGGTAQLPVVVTNEVTGITAHSASCGGEVTSDGGAEVTERGICWSTNTNPTISNSHVSAGTGMGTFSAMMSGLSANTTYHVRAYATNEAGTAYGSDKKFTTLEGGGGEHEYVDLGLPSGLLWATCNLGANAPEEYGDYFAWGETQPKSTYYWHTYLYCMGAIGTLTKYCNNSIYGYNGFTDNLTTLLPEDDAATANWGSGWRMPTKEEWQELYNNTTCTWTIQNGVNGRLFTAANGNSLFMPAAGYRVGSGLDFAGSDGIFWSGSLNTDGPNYAYYFSIDSGGYHMSDGGCRIHGLSVRAVRSSAQN
jgi:hypothetical protein